MEEVKSNYKTMLKGLLISVLLTLALLFILSVILALTSVKESIMSFSIIFISAFSIMISTFYVSHKIREKGMIYGGIIGFSYMLILYLISSIINSNFSLTIETVVMIMAGIIRTEL